MGRSRAVVLSFAYWSLRRLLELVVLRFRTEREKEIEILLLQHQRSEPAVAHALGDRQRVREWASQQALDLIRRKLM